MSLCVVIAPDSFKGTATAVEAAEAIATGWLSVRKSDQLTLLPQADGGEGTVDAIASAQPQSLRHTVSGLTGPDGRTVSADWLELPNGCAVIDLASVCGLPLMANPDALNASTRGLGELITAAVAAGSESLIIGLGGSASTDGGAGALSALGLRMVDKNGGAIPDGGGALATLARLDRTALIPPPPGGVIVLSDVSTPLLGPLGAATIFGPQKGASRAEVHFLENALATFARLLGGEPAQPGAGAAGGTAFGLSAAWGAIIRSGAETIAAITGLNEAIAQADVVITGEGQFDSQSLMGKSVGHTLQLVDTHRHRHSDGHSERGPRAWVIAGNVDESFRRSSNLGDNFAALPRTLSLSSIAGTRAAASADPRRWLQQAGTIAAQNTIEP